ncbi:putative adenylate cyclase [Streptomyces sp. Tu6071]|uniref:adenylate/guanylate cyclase domain-containing protein n=1 Tax=Streptomyces sp. Tu6071 TaxID=355249 RepID=UPI00020E52EA|nr:adenylate/guanylate cyclase domain-containing protein [Streptomyces sp. Tu6071]EGJ73795.1 putative adenylate cyclase [Streptomyces sp. Tu6071]
MSGAETGADQADAPGAHPSLEEALLGGARRWTRREVAELAGIPGERTERIWKALGFPTADDKARVFTDADVEALRVGERLIAAGLMTEHSETAMARALGHHLSRLAEWQVDTLLAWLEPDDLPEGGEGALATHALALLPEMELLQRHVWRRHLAARTQRARAETRYGSSAARGTRPARAASSSASRAEHLPPGDAGLRTLAVGFTDMVGYTRLTRAPSSTDFMRVLDSFEELTSSAVVDGGGRSVKTIGDEILYVCESPAAAASIALELAAGSGTGQLPTVRTGLAYGEVLHRFGDVYGAVVNVAARLTSLARSGTVLIDTALASELHGCAHYELTALRPVSVRGYSRLRPTLLKHAGRTPRG